MNGGIRNKNIPLSQNPSFYKNINQLDIKRTQRLFTQDNQPNKTQIPPIFMRTVTLFPF